MKYKLNLGIWGSVFAVPNILVDTYIKTASENAIKVILFLLRNSELEADNEIIKNSLNLKSDADVEEAIEFWKERGLIDIKEGELIQLQPEKITSLYNEQITEFSPQEQLTFEIKKYDSVRKIDASRPIRYSSKEISERIKESTQMDYLFKRAETLCGRPLKNSEQQMLISIVDYEGLDCDVAIMLIEYCYTTGKTTPKYIQTLAAEWAENEINTISKAEERITTLKNYNGIEMQLKRELEFKSAFSGKQKQFIDRWANELAFSIEMIVLSYQITLDSTGNVSFPYMNKILESWRQKGYTVPQQVEQEKQEYKNDNKTQSSFDVDDLDKRAFEEFRS